MKKPIVLVIIDGWGIAPDGPGNAISEAHITHIPSYWKTYPHTVLDASGSPVGSPPNEDGNSETGHINLGAGRTVPQDVIRINSAIDDGSFFQNEAFMGTVKHAKNHQSNIHLIGCFTDATVHASRKHLCALLEFFKTQQCESVYLHLFTDGRDAPQKSSLSFFNDLHAMCSAFSFAHVATIMGRYYGMDRDFRWERTKTAYDAIIDTCVYTANSPQQAISMAYERGETDEFIQPTAITNNVGVVYPRISDNDSVIFFNYRVDRPRQLTRALTQIDFETKGNTLVFDPFVTKYAKTHRLTDKIRNDPFTRKKVLKNLFFVTMTQYEPNTPCVAAFPLITVPMPLSKVLSDAHIRQLKISESEKERFVTYYFNGMREEPYPDEDRLIIPSPDVPTYDLAPQMSAIQLTDTLIDRLSLDLYGCIIANFANPDMVGHTGNIEAAKIACQTIDTCISRIVTAVLNANGTCVITADHGNVEEMLKNGQIVTKHSSSLVPCIVISNAFNGHNVTLPHGKLGDIAPTVLSLLHISKPKEMTGLNLLENIHI